MAVPLTLAALLLAQPAMAEDAAANDPSSENEDSRVIVVTASPLAHMADDTPTITSVVNSDDIRKAGGASIADALAKVPGVSGTGFASGASRPIIRGMDAQRVRILENGTSVSDVSDVGPDHGVPIDPLSARRIEVVRGAGTLRYGSQAIGGVINAINDRVPTAMFTDAVAGELTGSFGTADDSWQGSALVDAQLGNFALHADAFVRDTGDYDTPLGKLSNSFFRGHGTALGGSYFFGSDAESHVGAAVEQYDAEYGIPGEDSFIDLTQTKVITRSSFALGSGLFKSFKLDGSYADYEHSEMHDGHADATFKNREWNGRAELLFNPLGPVAQSALGFEYMHRDFTALGEASSYLLPTETETVAGYVFTDIEPIPRLHIEASARVEHARVSGTPISDVFVQREFTPLSGAIGVLYELSDTVKIGVTGSTTGRAPAITEMFARGPHEGSGTFEFGNPGLSVERAKSLETTLRVDSGRFGFEGSIYGSWFNNYIYGHLTGRTCEEDGSCSDSPDGEMRELVYRQQKARFRGLEGQASYALIDSAAGTLEASILADYTRATFEDGKNVPRIPAYRVGGGLEWTSAAFDAGVTLMHVGDQNRFGTFDTRTEGYDSLSAQMAWRPFRAEPGIEFAIVGQNLTNAVQRNAAALNKDWVVMPGRTVRFMVRLATF